MYGTKAEGRGIGPSGFDKNLPDRRRILGKDKQIRRICREGGDKTN